MDNILELRNINKSFFNTKALSDVSLSVKPGEIRSLVGENGAGKSSLIKIVSGVYQPDKDSEIFFEGRKIPVMTTKLSMDLGIAVIYQDLSLFPNLTIAENIARASYSGLFYSQREIESSVQETLKFLGLELDIKKKLKDVSVGMQQLVAIARAIHMKSKLIIMDEPTASLSSGEIEILFSVIAKLKKRNIAVIYISHKLEEIFDISDSIFVLRDGKLIITGKVDEFDNDSLISYMVGRELTFERFEYQDNTNNKEILSVVDLSTGDSEIPISFKLYQNEILGFTGLVGAGRSELFQSIIGVNKVLRGDIYLFGNRVSVKKYHHAISKGICYLPEDRRVQGLFLDKSVAFNISAAKLETITNDYKLLDFKKENDIAKKYVDNLKIRPGRTDIETNYLSGGNQQKVMFSRMLNVNPKLLIVDEPTAGVDIATKQEIYKLLRSLCEQGVGVIVISSDVQEILTVADRILVMHEGSITGELMAKEATQENILRFALGGATE